MDEKLREKVEVLDGSRGGGVIRLQSALRLADLAPLLQMPPLRAKPTAGANPTAQEFEAALSDIKTLQTALSDIAAILQAKLR